MLRRKEIEKAEHAAPQPQAPTVMDLLQDLVEASERQAGALESLRGRIEVETRKMRAKVAEQANLLGEARRELADMVAALEMETHRRQVAEHSVAALEAVVAGVRAALSVPVLEEPIADETSIPTAVAACLESVPSDAPDAAAAPAETPTTDEQANEPTPVSTVIAGNDGVTTNASSIRIDLREDDVELLDRLVARQGSSRDEVIAGLIRSAALPERAGIGASQHGRADGVG